MAFFELGLQELRAGWADEKIRWLAIVQLAKDSTLQRLREDVPKIVEFLSRFSKGEQEQAFRSSDNATA